jgi:hypothetical protein
MKTSAISRHWPAEAEREIDALLEGAMRADAGSSIRRAILDLEQLKERNDLRSNAFAKIAGAITLLRDAARDQAATK